MLEGSNAEKSNQFAHRITSYMRNGVGRRHMAASLFIPQTLLYLPPSPRSLPPYAMPHILPSSPLCPGNLTLILRNSIHRIHFCMIHETADFKDKESNQEQEKFHKD